MEKKLASCSGKGSGGGRTAGGAAPFASLEDLSDESPPGEADKLEVPGVGGGPPRIDISRASSSSHHEDSSPERELFAGEGGGTAKVGLGFTEDMALELRSSTEELDFHESEPERKSKKKKLQQQQAVIVTKYDLETESEKENRDRERKDSGCSEGGLLFIGGGRSSRLSSVGSAASGGSGVSAGSGVSHLSAASNYSRASRMSSVGSKASGGSGLSGRSGLSHLSATSNYSKSSRCSSPHRMLVETSFCGPKPIPTLSLEAEYPPSESVEATLLKRKVDPGGAVLPNCLEVSAGKPRRTSSERTVRASPVVTAARSASARTPRKPAVKKRHDENALVRIIPLHGSVDEPEDDYEDEQETESGDTRTDDDFHPENGIYIPLKGPIIDTRPTETPRSAQPQRSRSAAPDEPRSRSATDEPRRRKPEIDETDLVRFISLHGDDDEEINRRNYQSVQFKSWTDTVNAVTKMHHMDLSDWPKPRPRSPEAPKPGKLELEKKKNGRSLGQIPRDESRTPSPASSFSRGNIFRRSSDSSGSSKKSMSSSDSKTKKDGRNKSMFTSLFKKNVKETPPPRSQSEKVTSIALKPVEYKPRKEEKGQDQIIIPLHSPDEVVEPLIRYDPEKYVEEDLRKMTRPQPRKEKQEIQESQRTSLEIHTIEKNIVVVDVINEDTKDQPFKPESKTPTDVKKEIVSETKSEPQSEAKKPARESKRNVNELEVYDIEPRVRRSSSVCSRETDAISSVREEMSEKERKPVDKERLRDVEVQVEGLPERVMEEKQEKATDETRPKSEEKVERKSVETEGTSSRSGSAETCRLVSQETVIENYLAKEEERSRGRGESPIQEDILSTIMHDEEIESLIKKDEDSENNITKSENLERRSSESEAELDPGKVVEETDEERKGLFLQTDSVEDELPYVPTTLPQERSVAVPIIPVRQRVSEVKTCPVDRPRSTTPIQPAPLEEYAAFHEPRPVPQEKMQITLPRTESVGKGRGRGKSSPPPLPPRAPQWVAFDEPERRRTPRRITTLPLTYVNPEECTCECHEPQHRSRDSTCSKAEHCSPTRKQTRTDKDKEKRYRTADR